MHRYRSCRCLTLAIARQASGAVLLCSQLSHPNFDRYFASWRIVAHRHWHPAFNIVGNDLLECEQGPGIYLVGDHNIVGLEDAYLTGVYAANQIIARVSDDRTRERRQPVAARDLAA